MHHLLISEGNSAGEIRLTEARYLLGRGKNCDIKLASLSASRIHALLIRIEDRYHLHDGNPENDKPSTAGTHLWNRDEAKWEKRKAVILKHGDRIMFAPDAIFRYLCIDFNPSPDSGGTDAGATWV